MDNNKKLAEKLLKADGIDLARIDKMEKNEFSKILDSQLKHTNIFTNILKSKPVKFAVAAMILIGVLAGVKFFEDKYSINTAWADVQAAFLAKKWVHLKYDNGTESWYNLKTGDHCAKQLYWHGDSFVYIDRTNNLRQRYTPAYGKHISEDRPTVYPNNIMPPYEPQTSWDTIVGYWEETAKAGGSKYWNVEMIKGTLNGKDALRFDIYYVDALGQKLLTKQLWADPITRLPLQIKEKLTSQEQKDQKLEHITGIFSFPETGPLSIYDLGVPKDLLIAKNYDKAVNPSIEEIIKTAKQNYDNFPKCFRFVIWENDRESEIEIIWRDGERIRFDHYCNLAGSEYSQYHLTLPTMVEGILSWVKTQPPMSIYLDDGIKSYHRKYHPAFDDLKTPKTRVTRSWPRGLPNIAHVVENQWEYMEQDSSNFAFISDAPESLKQYIGIRTESGDIRRDYYIDPEHDYIQVQNIWWKLQNGKWEKEREYIAVNMAQLPDGQWYITKRKLIVYPDSERGTSGYECNYTIDFKLLDVNGFPADIFNGEKLLENAEIETY